MLSEGLNPDLLETPDAPAPGDDEDEDEDEDETVEEPEDEKAVEEPKDEKENTTEEAYNEGTEAYEQRLAEAIDALPDEEDLEVDIPPLELPPVEVELFQPQEQDNLAYADAMKAYYEEKDYQRAIEKFREAIENEAQDTGGNVTDSNSIVAKAMYWQAEAYVKVQDIPQAIVTFENLSQTYKEHYLSLAAKRRTAQLNPE
jgi:TolA-binding protein